MMEKVFTPKTDIPFNFGPSASRDNILFSAERPANGVVESGDASVENIQEWISFMKDKGIGHVLVLLDENELAGYPSPGLFELYREGGLVPHATPLGEEGAFQKIIGILNDIEGKGETAVTHCTGGTGRAGRVIAAWLASRYSLTPEEATQEAVDSATDSGVHRLGDVGKLKSWMGVES